jgi:hypothetical protein
MSGEALNAYIQSLASEALRAYAETYLTYLRGGTPLPVADPNLYTMSAAQQVRIRLAQLL